MAGEWTESDLSNPEVRPETDWQRTVMGAEGPFWCSLRLSLKYACIMLRIFDPKAGGSPGDTESPQIGPLFQLFESGARMAPSSYAALALVVQCKSDNGAAGETVGTELLVDPKSFDLLQKLTGSGFEITDIGLALPGTSLNGVRLEMGEITPPTAGVESCGNPVIVAIIDDGIAIANHRFRASDNGTRIAHFLDMSLPDCPSTGTMGPVSKDELFGQSWTKQQIDEFLERFPDDEGEIYRAMGMIDTRTDKRQPLKARQSHGTHVLDIATGYDHTDASARATLLDRPILAVQLPTEVVQDRSDAWMPCALKLALDWILVRADALSAEIAKTSGQQNKRLPLVLNFSFGSLAGPHDGLSDIERRLSQFIDSYRCGGDERLCTVVLSAGNGLQSRSVARVAAGDIGSCMSFPWRVQPDDRTSSFVHIWLPKGGGKKQQVKVSVVPPRDKPGEAKGSKLGKALDWKIGETVHARIYHQRAKRPDCSSREHITIAIRPTAGNGDPEPVVPAGLWQIHIENLCLNKGAWIDLRIQRDESVIFDRRKGRQSYFDHPDYVRFEPVSGALRNDERLENPPVLRQRTLSAYASGSDTLVVAGYRHADGEPASYSASGPTSSKRTGPDLAAVSEESPYFRGAIAATTYSGSVGILNGTSVSAPLVTRHLADIVGEGGGVGQLLCEVKAFEKNVRSGPHGPYCKAREIRHGKGRLAKGATTPYRTRIEG